MLNKKKYNNIILTLAISIMPTLLVAFDLKNYSTNSIVVINETSEKFTISVMLNNSKNEKVLILPEKTMRISNDKTNINNIALSDALYDFSYLGYDEHLKAHTFMINALFRSFSQPEIMQDQWILTMTNNKKNGYFIEIGAGNGIDLSNTYLLEKNYEWNGICIEPSRQYSNLIKNRKCSCSQDLLFDKKMEVIFLEDYQHGQENWFSGIKDHFGCNKTSGKEFVRTTTTLEEVLDRYNAPAFIDYLSIDTEGSEFEILKNFPFNTKYTIALITVEHNHEEPKRSNIRKLLEQYGYQFVKESAWDDFYALRTTLKN